MQWVTQSHGLTLAVIAGVMASLGSTCAKLAMSGDVIKSHCQLLAGTTICQQVCLYIQVMFFLLIFVCNAIMWTFFTKSLQYCSSSVQATVTNTASNFLFTALVGLVLFNESLSLRWWFGSLLILLGLILINRGNLKDEQTKQNMKDK